MKLTQLALVLPAAAALLISGCDRSAQQAEAQRLAEERAALEREKAALATSQAAAQQTLNDAERARLDAERADLNRDKDRLAAQSAAQSQADQDARGSAEREGRLAAERRAAEARERQAREDAQNSQTAQSVSYFYDTLDPYGDWVQVEPYGYAFRPNTARNVDWRPYTDGDWIYTDYGWTWRSDEPFGWATYHYGRWTRAPRVGWIWVPGTEWGPAWVSWRNGSDYVGWAPLPPDAWSSRGFNAAVDSYFNIGPGMYNFVRVVDFGEPSYAGRIVEPARNVTIINQTTNITNVVYKTVQNRTTIVNGGPDLTTINQRARQPVRRMRVERLEGAAPQQAKVQGDTLQMVIPALKKPASGAAAKPRQVKESVKAAELDRGWAGAKAEEPKMRAEAARQAREAEQAERSEPKPTSALKAPPATPPTPFRPATVNPSPESVATPPPVRPPQPVHGAPGRPARPAKPELPPNEARPLANPMPSEAPALPTAPPALPPKPEKHGKNKGHEAPPQPQPEQTAPSAPPVPGEPRPPGHGKHPDASRGESIPGNRPQHGDAPTKLPQPKPGVTPNSQANPTDPEDKAGHKKRKETEN